MTLTKWRSYVLCQMMLGRYLSVCSIPVGFALTGGMDSKMCVIYNARINSCYLNNCGIHVLCVCILLWRDTTVL